MTLPPTVAAMIRDHLETAYPEEGCGAILRAASGRVFSIPWKNVAGRPQTGYAIRPDDFARLIPFEEAGAVVIGLYHSHPDAPAQWSATDAQGALCQGAPAYPEARQWVVRVDRGHATEWRAYRWEAACGAYVGDASARV